MTQYMKTVPFLFVLALSSLCAAQSRSTSSANHQQYQLVDLGTLGGPNSFLPLVPPYHDLTPTMSLSARGTFTGFADTSIPDPFSPFCFVDECLVVHAVSWINGSLKDLSALPGGGSSATTWISQNGRIVGLSENGEIDPLSGFPSSVAVIWTNAKPVSLGTLEGGYQSFATAVNNKGQIVGGSNNTVPDPNSLLGTGTQTRAFLWQNGSLRDLGSLDNTSDAMALFINESGQIVGQSYAADSIPTPPIGCSDSPLSLYAFFWDKGEMSNIGTLGGHCAFPYFLNNRGQVVGQANLQGDTESHPFLWQPGQNMKDLGTLGGHYGYAVWINDAGSAVGGSTNPGEGSLLPTLWQKGQVKNLHALPGNVCAAADNINARGQVVGGSGFYAAPFFPDCTDSVEHAVLWDHGTALDLNLYNPPGSGLTLNEAWFINDAGEISGTATTADGTQHTFLLVPCEGAACAAKTFPSQLTPAAPSSIATTQSGSMAYVVPGRAKTLGRGASRH